MYDENKNGTTGNNGNRGKFSDRLKKIRRDKAAFKTKGNASKEDENILFRGGRNILKIALALPSVVYTNIKGASVSKSVTKNSNVVESTSESKKIKVNKIRNINVSLMKKKKEIYLKDLVNSGIVLDKTTSINTLEQDEIGKLQKEILDLIKKRLVKNVNELEVLQSELYILKELDGDSVSLERCQENIKEIKKLLSKVKTLKEKYDNLKDNVDLEYMLEYGDDFLIDKILELKELCSRDDISFVVDNYKILDEYKFLYLKIDKLHDDTLMLEEERNKKVEELKQRDIDFDKLKEGVYSVTRENDRYNKFVSAQEKFLADLEERISLIDSHEKVTYHFKGFNKLVSSSFKYLGLLLINPLKGLIPGIVTQTLITRDMVHNLKGQLEWEVNRKMVYEAIDYSKEIELAITNLDSTSILINSTLSDLVSLKSTYINKFRNYESDVPGYRDTIKKINKMENAILGTKVKIEMMRERMKEKEKQNSDKLKRVKKLNDSVNNNQKTA